MAPTTKSRTLHAGCLRPSQSPSELQPRHAQRELFGLTGSCERGLSFSSDDSKPAATSDQDEVIDSPLQQRHRKRKRVQSFSEGMADTCRMCGVVYASTTARDAHERLDHPFICSIDGCGKRFADEQLAIQHVDDYHQVHKNERFLCESCNSLCLTLHDFELHRATVAHSNNSTLCARRVYICVSIDSCRQVYKKKDKYMQHVARYHTPSEDGTLFQCDRCDESFPTRHERSLHRLSAHPNQREDHHSPSFKCEVEGCGKSYSKREHLRRHVQTTHEAPAEKPHQCQLCSAKFTHSHGLTRHVASCHSETTDKPYACTVCLLTFKKKSLLQAHSFVHTGVLPFECSDCGERFHKRFQLVRHERKHAGSRSAQVKVMMCDVGDCDELFFTADERQQHLIQAHGHSNEASVAVDEQQTRRGLECLVCHRGFERKQNLRAHLRTHFEAVDERKLHVCPMDGCGKSYTKKSNVMAHYNAVHDPVKSMRFKCPYGGCDGAFGYKKVLLTHIASIHERAKASSTETGETTKTEREEGEPETKRRRGREAIGVLARALGVGLVGTQLSEIDQQVDNESTSP